MGVGEACAGVAPAPAPIPVPADATAGTGGCAVAAAIARPSALPKLAPAENQARNAVQESVPRATFNSLSTGSPFGDNLATQIEMAFWLGKRLRPISRFLAHRFFHRGSPRAFKNGGVATKTVHSNQSPPATKCCGSHSSSSTAEGMLPRRPWRCMHVCGTGAVSGLRLLVSSIPCVPGTKTPEKLVHSVVPKPFFNMVLHTKCRQFFGDTLYTETKCKSARDAANGVVLPRWRAGQGPCPLAIGGTINRESFDAKLRLSIFCFFFSDSQGTNLRGLIKSLVTFVNPWRIVQ